MNTLWDITRQNKKVQKDRANLGREMKVKTPSYFQFLMTRLNRLRFADAPPLPKKTWIPEKRRITHAGTIGDFAAAAVSLCPLEASLKSMKSFRLRPLV